MKSIIALISVLLICTQVSAQPSFHVELKFKLYDEKGNIVDYDNFVWNYELLGAGNRSDHQPLVNSNISRKHFYVDSTQTFNVSGSVVYNPLIRKIVFGEDTMTLLVPFFTSPRRCYIDSLVFKPGEYWVYGDLSFIDFDRAKKEGDFLPWSKEE